MGDYFTEYCKLLSLIEIWTIINILDYFLVKIFNIRGFSNAEISDYHLNNIR